MIHAKTIAEARETVRDARWRGEKIGFVPTMGFLHEGHLALIDEARSAGATFVVVSVFVNPKQFGPREDLSTYPRDLSRDEGLLRARNVDLLFAPDAKEMYPDGFQTAVHVGGVGEPLEGARRPGHFDGVATVVLKLLNIVAPDLAVFGRKDAQQCAVISRLVRDLDLPVELRFGETVRENDGLAMSSRNSYLTPGERRLAPTLYRALETGAESIRNGNRDAASIEQIMAAALDPAVTLDYLAVVDPETFAAPVDFERDLLLAGAIRIGTTRLIDNIHLARAAVPPDAAGSRKTLEIAT